MNMPQPDAIKLFETLSNVGRWGSDDELGTLNYITPAKRVAAAGLVDRGEVLSLSYDLSTERSPKNPAPLVHRMLYEGHSDPFACIDIVEIAPHGWETTHLDAVGHMNFEGRMWNGRTAAEVVRPDGMRFASIMPVKGGIVTKGVLLDVPRARGASYLAATDGISAADLEAAERSAGVRVESGDAVVIRSGLQPREATEGPADPKKTPGIQADCLPWFHDREVALYAGDVADKEPSGYDRIPKPLHQIGMVAMGLYILDNVAVEGLARQCAGAGRYEFLLTVAPLRIPKGTGSAVNPLAIF